MEYLAGVLAALGGGLLVLWRATWPVLRPALQAAAEAAAQRALLAMQERLAGGAGRLAADLRAQAAAAGFGEVPASMLDDAITAFRITYDDSLKKANAGPEAPMRLIVGELAKLGMTVAPR